MEAEKADEFKYWAFISYSHSDKEWGDWLHRGLETYRVPKRLVGKPSRDGVVPKRAYPVFRDREELPGSSDLGENINAALRASRYLIVICSPRSAVSRWVNEEIKSFKAMGREGRILCLVVEGEPNASDRPELGLLECFPEAVRFRVGANRQVTDERVEPIAADARKGKDGKTNAKLKLLAGILGVAYDELKQRDKQRRRRRKMQLTAAALALVALISGIIVWNQFQRAAERRRSTAQAEFNSGLKLLEQGEAPGAVAWIARAVRDDPSNEAARTRLVSLLTQHNWITPATPELAHKGAVVSAAFSPDGKRVVTASEDNTVRLWDAQTGKPLCAPIAQKRASSVEFSLDGTRFVAAGADVRVFDGSTGKQIGAALKHDRPALAARFSPDGSAIATGSVDGMARIWSTATGELRAQLPHGAPVLLVAWSPDSKRVATAVVLGETAQVWEATSGLPVTAPIKIKSMPNALEFSPDGTKLMTAAEFVGEVWDAGTGAALFKLQHEGSLVSAHFSPDGTRILTGSFDKTARLWNAENGAAIGSPLKHREGVHFAVFSPDAQRILTTTREGTAQLWDAKTGRAISEPFHHRDDILAASFDAKGERVLTASKDGTAQVWDALPSAMMPLVLRAPDRITAAEFDRDNAKVRTLANDGTAQIWDAASGKLIETSKQPDGASPILSGDGKRRAVIDASRMSISVNDVATNSPIGKPFVQKLPAMTAALDRTGARLAIAGVDSVVICFDVATSEPCFPPIKHAEMVRRIAFSPDGTRLATASMDRAARLWDAQTGRAAAEPLWHDAVVEHVQFSADGQLLAAASWDHQARVWNLATQQLLLEPFEHEEEAVRIASVSLDGRRLVTTAANGAFIWKLPLLNGKTPAWLSLLAEAIGGAQINDKALLAPANNRWQILEQTRRTVATGGDDSFHTWARWLLADRRQRPIAPFAVAKLAPPASRPSVQVSVRTPVAQPADAPEHLLLNAWLERSRFVASQMKEPAIAAQSAEEALKLAKQIAAAQPASFEAHQDIGHCDLALADAQLDASQPQNALASARDAIAVAERMALIRPNDKQAQLALSSAWGTTAYYLLFNRQPAEALDAAQRALQLDPTQAWVKIDLADAYLLNEQFDKAQQIYRENKNVELQGYTEKTFGAVALKTLDELKAHGIEHPDMQKARDLLKP